MGNRIDATHVFKFFPRGEPFDSRSEHTQEVFYFAIDSGILNARTNPCALHGGMQSISKAYVAKHFALLQNLSQLALDRRLFGENTFVKPVRLHHMLGNRFLFDRSVANSDGKLAHAQDLEMTNLKPITAWETHSFSVFGANYPLFVRHLRNLFVWVYHPKRLGAGLWLGNRGRKTA